MDDEISTKLTNELKISPEIIKQYTSYFTEIIRPLIKTNYLSHLVTTVENLVNNKRMIKILNAAEVTENVDVAQLRNFLASKTFRLYSIMLNPIDLKRRATTRYHTSGAIIYYNSCYDEKTIRILIAHEVGHIVNKELMENTGDSEQTANLFAHIAMDDKNKFYAEECDRFITKSNIQIFNDIMSICPLP